MVFYLNKLDSPSFSEAFCQTLVQIDPVILEKNMNMWKAYDNKDADDDRQRTDLRQKMLTWAFGSGWLKDVGKIA